MSNVIGIRLDTSSIHSILSICDRQWSSQPKNVVLAFVVFSIWSIWSCRNKLRFKDKKVAPRTVLNGITNGVSLSGNHSKGHFGTSMHEFAILKQFAVSIKPTKSVSIKEVRWCTPPCYWIKCNSNGVARGSPGFAACGGIFRDSSGAAMGCFAVNLGIDHSLHTELNGAMYAIELAFDKGWHSLWLECDSMLVIQAFKSINIVLWRLRNRWKDHLYLISRMRFISSDIFRECNTYADKIATFGIGINGFHWWDNIPNFINDFYRNRVGLPNYRFK